MILLSPSLPPKGEHIDINSAYEIQPHKNPKTWKPVNSKIKKKTLVKENDTEIKTQIHTKERAAVVESLS